MAQTVIVVLREDGLKLSHISITIKSINSNS